MRIVAVGSKIVPIVEGSFPVTYKYTAGPAAEKFLRELKNNGKLIAARCGHCKINWIPPRLFCERCLSELTEFQEISPSGRLDSFTVLHEDNNGKKLRKPEVIGLISFEQYEGRIVHRIAVSDPQQLRIGLKVAAVLKPPEARRGSILDIEHFRPL